MQLLVSFCQKNDRGSCCYLGDYGNDADCNGGNFPGMRMGCGFAGNGRTGIDRSRSSGSVCWLSIQPAYFQFIDEESGTGNQSVHAAGRGQKTSGQGKKPVDHSAGQERGEEYRESSGSAVTAGDAGDSGHFMY